MTFNLFYLFVLQKKYFIDLYKSFLLITFYKLILLIIKLKKII